MAQVLGQVTVKVGSDTLKSKHGATINPGGPQRSPVGNDQNTVDQMRGEVMPSSVSCTLVVDENYNSDTINGWESVTLVFNGDNGLAWTIPDAFVTAPPEISGGEAQVTFNGSPAERL